MVVLHLCYRVFLLNVRLSVIIGFMSGNISSFVLNKYFTFRNLSIAIFRQYAKYFLTSMTGLLWTVFLMYLFYEKWEFFSTLTSYNEQLCKMSVAAIVMGWNFTIIRHWTLASYELGPLKLFDKSDTQLKPYISVIIPAYNEEHRIVQTLTDVNAWLSDQTFLWEVIVVNDGSTDNTISVVQKLFQGQSNLTLISLDYNQGKGAAIRKGMLYARGDYRLFMDADNQIHISELEKFIPLADKQSILIGSKYADSQNNLTRKDISFSRKLVSRLGNLMIRFFFDIQIKDTQCGFKLFPAQIADNLFRLQLLNRFSFDVEILTLATLFGVQIIELPITLYPDQDSRIRTLHDSLHVGLDLIRIKLGIWCNRYKKLHNTI